MMIKAKIMRPELFEEYINSFQDYAINIMYGNIVIGADIEEEWKNKPVEE